MALPLLWRSGLATLAAVLTPTLAFAQQPAPPPSAPPPTAVPPAAPTAAAPTLPAKSVPAKITTTDSKGTIYIDDKQVAEGTFVGDLTVGTHTLKITREGYDTLTEQLVVSDGSAVNKNYTLALNSKVNTTEVAEEVDRPEGIYGGFNLHGFLTPGGTGNSIETLCDRKGEVTNLTSCDAGGGLGAGLGGFIGYHWDPVGIELFMSGAYDVRTDKLSWASAELTGAIQNNPARDEEFVIRRVGGLLLARLRLTKQWKKVRLSLPIGAGIAYRVMHLSRTARAKDPPNAVDGFTADSDSYISPAVQLEPTVAWRITPGTALTFGIQFSMEAAANIFQDENPASNSSNTHRLGASGISTPAYTLASSSQIFIGPTIGMMFGP